MKRRKFLADCAGILLLSPALLPGTGTANAKSSRESAMIRIALCGDVMTGRGIDQILPTPSEPQLYESYVKSAATYVELAQSANGPFPERVDFSYPWGDALASLDEFEPDARIINLETAVTASNDYWKGKGINYRMHPDNVPCLEAAGIDCCVVANNHVLDWGYTGLAETLSALHRAGIQCAGAGGNIAEARRHAAIDVAGKGRVLVFAYGSPSSGVPIDWVATESRAGINLLAELSDDTVRRIGTQIEGVKRESDIVVASIHWGSNWGYDVSEMQIDFAHRLIDEAGVDVIHGHSSHHPRGIEIYGDRPIFYGCGDFLNDYEGISGYEAYRDDLVLMYLVTMEPVTGRLERLELLPFQIRKFRLNHVSREDADWLRQTMDRECSRFGGRVVIREINRWLLVKSNNGAAAA